MSAQTTEARAERDYRRERWLDHQRDCAQCSTAARSRRARGMCGHGRVINKAYADAQAALSREIQADKAPAPGQATIFELIPGDKDG